MGVDCSRLSRVLLAVGQTRSPHPSWEERAMSDEQLRDLISRTRHTTVNAQRVVAENERLLLRSREVLKRASEALAKARTIVYGAARREQNAG